MVVSTEDVLVRYKLATLNPTTWPVDRNLYESSDSSDEDEELEGELSPRSATTGSGMRQSKTSTSISGALTGTSFRTQSDSVRSPASEPHGQVQKDEADPLGGPDSVVRTLRRRGLPVDENAQLRNRFLLSSTTFSPTLYLSQVHSDATTSSLLQGLDFLTKSIDQKSASLKLLVESNFERFVQAKSTIDGVYEEMKKTCLDKGSSKTKGHSRQVSKSSGSYKFLKEGPVDKAPPNDTRNHALNDKGEYGVAGIKMSLIDAGTKAEEVWGPALGGQEREESLKAILNMLDEYRGLFEVGAAIADCTKRKDYETLVEEYTKARKYFHEAKRMAQNVANSGTILKDIDIHKIIVTGQMWADVEDQLEVFKRGVWRKLVATPSGSAFFGNQSGKALGGQHQEHMELISILLELGVQDNPIWVWLLSRYDSLKTKISTTAERSRIAMEVLRRRLASSSAHSSKTIAVHLRSSVRHSAKGSDENLDAPEIIELWTMTVSCLEALLSPRTGILAEIIDFWDTAQSFIDEKAQKSLPIGVEGQSKRHHTISGDGIRDLENGVKELVNLTREAVQAYFCEAPIEDISPIFSPIPHTPETPRTPFLNDPRFSLSRDVIVPPSPRTGEPWDEYAFWPPHATAISGVHYLSRILALLSTATSEMAALAPIKKGKASTESLKGLLVQSRERSISIICHVWSKDADNCKLLEDWTRGGPERKDSTLLPALFLDYETIILSGLQKILFLSNVNQKSGSIDLVTPPPSKLIQLVKGEFVRSIHQALDGMVENAEKPAIPLPSIVDATMSTEVPTANLTLQSKSLDAASRSVRMLLTLSNLQAFRQSTISQLIQQFENAFSIKLSDESKQMRELLGEADARLFRSFTKPTVRTIKELVQDGVLDPEWEPRSGTKPREVRSYVYSALLTLVVEHSILATTAPSLANQVLSYFLEQLSQELLATFTKRGEAAAKAGKPLRFSLEALMQATLDVEFVAQTLSAYTTDRGREMQSLIYLELDKGTDNAARTALQKELPEMRRVLKTLRERSRGEFICFKRPKREVTKAADASERSSQATNK